MALGIKNAMEGIVFILFVAIGLNFLITGIFINAVQFVLWLTIKPVNAWLYRKINYYFTFAIWGRKCRKMFISKMLHGSFKKEIASTF